MGLTAIGIELIFALTPNPLQKKSPIGASTDGVSSSSQYILRTRSLRTKPILSVLSGIVNQICCIIPGPFISAKVVTLPLANVTHGLPFLPIPRLLA